VDIDWETVVGREIEWLETLQESTVDRFKELAAPAIHFRDPTTDVQGIDAVVAMMHGWYKDLDQIGFHTQGWARDGDTVYSRWDMTFRVRKAPKTLWHVPGVTMSKYDEQGKIVEHVDYWDSGPLLAGFPVLGRVVSLIQKLM